MIEVVLVDDQALFRAGVAVTLESQEDLHVVGQAANGVQALQLIRAVRPDVVLLDLRMPLMDGVAVAEEVFGERWTGPRPRVIVLTTFSLDQAAARAIRAGASGFLLKDAAPEFLIAAIRTVHAGTSVLAPNELRELFALSVGAPAEPPPAAFETLSDREKEVFARVVRGASNGEIAKALYLGESTVKTHLSSILQKLELRDRVQLIVFANDHGLAGRGDDEADGR